MDVYRKPIVPCVVWIGITLAIEHAVIARAADLPMAARVLYAPGSAKSMFLHIPYGKVDVAEAARTLDGLDTANAQGAWRLDRWKAKNTAHDALRCGGHRRCVANGTSSRSGSLLGGTRGLSSTTEKTMGGAELCYPAPPEE